MTTGTQVTIQRTEPARVWFCAVMCLCCLSGCMAVHPDIDVSEVNEVDALTAGGGPAVRADTAAPVLAHIATPPEVTRSEPFSKLQRGHRVDVKVYDEPELSGVFTVGPSGTISYPLLGKVPIVGLSPSDAARLLHRMLGDGYLADPLVSVHRVADVATGYHILGAVRDPGTYETDTAGATMTLRNLFVAAGGLDPHASPVGVLLVRQGLDGPVAYPVHPSVLDPQRPASDTIDMQPGDIVTVPWRFANSGVSE